jgi:hypothetical protein
MPGPLAVVPSAISAINSFIARKGIQEAVKKYGKKAVDEARKHMKDMKTKKTSGQKKIEPVTKSQRATRSTARRTAATTGPIGAAVGAGMSGNDYSTANVDLNSGKGLPVADMSRSVDVRGTEEGMRYFQDGKEVRMPKK